MDLVRMSSLFSCSFCGKGRDDVQVHIVGPVLAPGVVACICNECVEECDAIIVEHNRRLEPTSFIGAGI